LCSTIGTFMWLMIRFFGSDSQSFMVESSYGAGGIVMVLAMYTRRHVGSRPVLPQLPLLSYHYLPSSMLAAVTLLRLLRFKTMAADIIFMYFTFFSSWTYLHFLYKVQGEDLHANSFTFIGMFPEVEDATYYFMCYTDSTHLGMLCVCMYYYIATILLCAYCIVYDVAV
jgi:hypothetical protein